VVDLVLRHGQILTLDPQRRILLDGAIAVQGGRIVAVGPDPEVWQVHGTGTDVGAPGEGPREVRDLRGALVHPGLIDGHNHTNSRAFRGLFPKASPDWSPVELGTLEAMTPELERVSAQLSAMEMIASGTTMYADTGSSIFLEETVAGVESVGIRGLAGWFIVFIYSLRELSASILLFTNKTTVIGVTVGVLTGFGVFIARFVRRAAAEGEP
jgi:cytosine/adenosine deaminase-related metal-dependent hydrolase